MLLELKVAYYTQPQMESFMQKNVQHGYKQI